MAKFPHGARPPEHTATTCRRPAPLLRSLHSLPASDPASSARLCLLSGCASALGSVCVCVCVSSHERTSRAHTHTHTPGTTRNNTTIAHNDAFLQDFLQTDPETIAIN
ncbi:hypothetical protein NL108_016779 [Boleophthalmus pectinirostris]|nr:hypothetical protein NL108_016779 [Boleophthalmus pectinirostris]